MERMIEARRQDPGTTAREREAVQAEVRAVESIARRTALVTVRLGGRYGHGHEVMAKRLGISRRTLADWKRRRRMGEDVRLRGRPSATLSRAERQSVLAFLSLVGPRVSLAVLRGTFPEHAPAALEDVRLRFRAVRRRRDRWVIRALRWLEAGWVWAMDFTKPPRPIDGIYPKILLVRDLGSGKQLAAIPCPDETASTVHGVLESLFEECGLPLVIKSDNGPAFREAEEVAWRSGLGISSLFSPPGFPAYNGTCEAGGGSIQTRAHHEAARHDRPGWWTCDDVEAARGQANQTARPWGPHGPTPDEAFAGRREVSPGVRRAFLASVAVNELEERAAREIGECAELDHYEQASLDRVAIARALIQHNILEYRRRRITLPFNSHSRAKIS